jgi:predicted ABC-type ATPase
LAGVNGAGKSSVLGAGLALRGLVFANPDTISAHLADGGLGGEEANSLAWQENVRRLREAIARRTTFAFETTLGGNTITGLLLEALESGLEVRMWYVGLESVELHLERVRARVVAGGHPVDEATVRGRWITSRSNLVQLVPRLTELQMLDNSRESDPKQGKRPEPIPLLHTVGGQVRAVCPLGQVPDWAKPAVLAALRHDAGFGED